MVKNVREPTPPRFFIVTIHNDHPSYVKHVSGSIYVFFTGIGCVCHLGMHCSGQILCEVDLLKAIDFSKLFIFSENLLSPMGWASASFGDNTGAGSPMGTHLLAARPM